MIYPANGRPCACAAGSIRRLDCGRVALAVAARLEARPISRPQ